MRALMAQHPRPCQLTGMWSAEGALTSHAGTGDMHVSDAFIMLALQYACLVGGTCHAVMNVWQGNVRAMSHYYIQAISGQCPIITSKASPLAMQPK